MLARDFARGGHAYRCKGEVVDVVRRAPLTNSYVQLATRMRTSMNLRLPISSAQPFDNARVARGSGHIRHKAYTGNTSRSITRSYLIVASSYLHMNAYDEIH